MTVKELRMRTGLSQSQFAKKFHIPVANIQHWEQGVRHAPSYVIYMMEFILNLEDKLKKGEKK